MSFHEIKAFFFFFFGQLSNLIGCLNSCVINIFFFVLVSTENLMKTEISGECLMLKELAIFLTRELPKDWECAPI